MVRARLVARVRARLVARARVRARLVAMAMVEYWLSSFQPK